jgi:hypothetical protein
VQLLLCFAVKVATICPISDADFKTISQVINRSIDAVEKQINLLADHLLDSRRRLNELQPELEKGPNYKESSS